MSRESCRELEPATRLPAAGASPSICTSTISRFSLRSSSRRTSPCSGTSCSTRPRMLERRADGRRDPEQVEVLLVARVVDARDHLPDAVPLLGELADDEVVLVVAGHGEHDARAGVRSRRARARGSRSRRRGGRPGRTPPRAARSGRAAARSASPRAPSRAASARRSRRPCRRLRRGRTSGRRAPLDARRRRAPSRAATEIAVGVGQTVRRPRSA